jgi:tetratricopeptide (TPR) repeat protein
MVLLYAFLLAFQSASASTQFDTTFREGLIALNRNDLTLAESRLSAASRLEPRNPRVWVALAQTCWKQGKPLEAETAAANAEANAADDAVARNAIDRFYADAGERFYFEAAQAHLRQQDFAAAIKTLDGARKRLPGRPQLELASGVAYYGLRRFPEAIDAFLRTISLDPGVEQPYVFLGRMLDQAEDRLPRILAVFDAFEKSAPGSYLPPFLSGKALVLANRPGDAEAQLRQSIALNDAFWESHFELGALLAARREWDAAAAELRRAAALNPSDAATHYHLARVYDRLGKPAEAAAERRLHAQLTDSK